MGLIDLPSLVAYGEYRGKLAADPDHKKNVAQLERSGATVAMNRSLIRRVGD